MTSFSNARTQAHAALAQALPQWPRTLADAERSHHHSLAERILAAALLADASRLPTRQPAHHIDLKRIASGDLTD